LARYVGADADDLVLIENASGGLNTILKALKFKRGDKILVTNVEYPVVFYTGNYLKEMEGVELLFANVTYPVHSHDQLIRAVEKAINENGSSISKFYFDNIC